MTSVSQALRDAVWERADSNLSGAFLFSTLPSYGRFLQTLSLPQQGQAGVRYDPCGILASMTTQTAALHELLEPIGRCLTPDGARKLVDVRASESVQKRMDRFAEKSTEGTLSGEERREYESLVSAGTFIAILQSKARTLLQESSES